MHYYKLINFKKIVIKIKITYKKKVLNVINHS